MSKRKKKHKHGPPPSGPLFSPTGPVSGFYLPAPEDLAVSTRKMVSLGGLKQESLTPLDYADEPFDEPLEDLPEFDEQSPLTQIKYAVELLSLLEWKDRLGLMETGIRALPTARKRELAGMVAKFLAKTEKEVQAMSLADLSRVVARYWYLLQPEAYCGIAWNAVDVVCRAASRKLFSQITSDYLMNEKRLREHQGGLPDLIWHYGLMMLVTSGRAPAEIRRSLEILLLPELPLRHPLPFQAAPVLPLAPLEEHLYQLAKSDLPTALRLAASLVELTAVRPRSWFLLGLLDAPPPTDLFERAWHFCGQLYQFSQAHPEGDAPFPLDAALQDPDLLECIFRNPVLTAGRDLVGLYLLAQIHAVNPDRAVDFFGDWALTVHPLILLVTALTGAQNVADRGEVERARSLVQNIPPLRKMGVLARALRRQGRFAEALAELEETGAPEEAERALCEAGIASLATLRIPEDPIDQAALAERLSRFADMPVKGTMGTQELRLCAAIGEVLLGSRSAAEEAYETLSSTSTWDLESFCLLAALYSHSSDFISECLEDRSTEELAELLRPIPKNLLRSAARKLVALEDPPLALPLLEALYEADPESLDPLLGNAQLLAASNALLRRHLDVAEKLPTANQKWFALQVGLEHARSQNDEELADAFIDACLEVKEPMFLPLQVQLLQGQIAAATLPEDRDLFVEHLCELSLPDAKPYLYPSLKALLGQKRYDAAEDVLETIELAGETPAQLAEFRRAIPAQWTAQPVVAPPSLPAPTRVLFLGGAESDRSRTDALRAQMEAELPGLHLAFDHTAWNPRNLTSLLGEVAKHDVIIASPLMRTTTYRRVHRRTLELGKVFAVCRGRGTTGMRNSILAGLARHAQREPRT